LFWTNQVNKLAGATLLIVAVCLALAIGFSFGVGDADPFESAEIEQFLVDINDNLAFYLLSATFFIVLDAVFGIGVAAALYLVFRDRHRVLAFFGFAFILASVVAVVGDAGNLTLAFLAHDFAGSSAGAIAPGDDVILQTARTMAIFSLLVGQLSFTSLNVGFLAFGALIAWSAAGTGPTPPRWIGWVMVVSGLAGLLSWLILVTEGAFVLFIIAGVATLIWLVALGGWLLLTPEPEATNPVPAAG
jgi:hypothetical protein